MKNTLIASSLIMISMCALNANETQGKPEPENNDQHITPVLKSNAGRFVFGQISKARRDQYLLDTKTGRLWTTVETKEGQIVLQPVPIQQITVDAAAYTPEPEEVAENYRQLITKVKMDESVKEFQAKQKSSGK